MTRSYWPLLLFLAAAWGASYLFIKVAVEDLEPAPMMTIRLLGAGVLLYAFVAAQGRARQVWRACCFGCSSSTVRRA